MKKIIFTLLTCCILHFASNAQSCGTSGLNQCVPDTNLKAPGFNPVTDSLPPFINGQAYTYTIQLKNYDTVPGLGVVNSLTIDSIGNLPSGLCWSSNKSNNTFSTSENGCILLSGTVCDLPGQYLLTILVHINGVGPINLKSNTPPVLYFIRVNNPGDTITPVDSTRVPFVPYGIESASCSAGITGVDNVINTLSIIPNPISISATATFVSTQSGKMTEEITNILGEEVHVAQREVKAGTNTFPIQRNNLPPGVYFYTLTDGVNKITQRMIISE